MGLGRPFLVASLLALALGVAIPPLLPFAIAGIILGSLPALVPWVSQRIKGSGRRPAGVEAAGARRQTARWHMFPLAAVLALLLLAAIPFLLFSANQSTRSPSLPLHRAELPPLEIEVPIAYHGRGVFLDDPDRVRMVDVIAVSQATLKQVSGEVSALRREGSINQVPPGLPAGRLVRKLDSEVPADLTEEGWSFSRRGTRGDTFVRRRTIPLDAGELPMDTGNEIPLPALGQGGFADGASIRMRMDSKSRLTLLAPPHVLDSSFPAASRQTHPISEMEELTIPVEGHHTVEVDVRSPWFRSEVSSTLVDWSRSGLDLVVGGLVTLILTAISKPVWARIKRLLRLDKLGAKKAGPTTP